MDTFTKNTVNKKTRYIVNKLLKLIMDKELPTNWKHNSGYHLNGDGKSIDYEHTSKDLKAILEAMDSDDEENGLMYYTVIFDISDGRPWEPVESHEFFYDKDDAKDHLFEMMEEKN